MKEIKKVKPEPHSIDSKPEGIVFHCNNDSLHMCNCVCVR